jgi:hypothetical protein
MFQAQTERSILIQGMVFLLVGILTIANGLWAHHEALHFIAVARRTVGTVVPSDNPSGSMRFETDAGVMEMPIYWRGHHPTPGSTIVIVYDPSNPKRWSREPGADPVFGVILAWIGVALFGVGAFLLTLGWVSRRRNCRPFLE